MMKFWCVISSFFDDGHVDAQILHLAGDGIPDDHMIEDIAFDKYINYFSSYEDALKHYQDCIRA